MQELRFKKTAIHCALLTIFCSVPTAFAAELNTEKNTSEDIETVTITVDQRQVNLQEAPLSVTALSNEVMHQANITEATDLNGYVPGLQINKSGGSERMVSIRGVGSQTPENFFSHPGVSFHMDGAYITNNIALNMGFLDVEHIEVQRGPQGTAFGAASTGGTINVISKKPEIDEFGGEITTGFGNYDYNLGKVAINIPVGESFALRAVAQTTSHDGYAVSNGIDGGYELDDADNDNTRLSGLWQVNDDISVVFITQHYDDHHNAAALKAINDPNPDPRVVSQDYPGKFDMSMDVDTAIVTWDLDWATLKSTSSYQDMDHAQSFDSDRSTADVFGGYDHVTTWATSALTVMQELSLSSAPGGFFEWVVGAMYLNSKSRQYINEFKGTDITDDTEILPKDLAVEDMPSNLSYAENSFVERTSWAPFIQGTFNLSEQFSVITGLRYNDDSFDGLSSTYFSEKSAKEFSSDVVTGKLALNYKLSNDNIVYGVYSKGYKPGGINSSSTSALVVSTDIQPEKVTAYEIGSKNRLLDNKLTVNLSAFYYNYDNMQYIQEDPIPYSGGIGNIPEANIWGAEIESTWWVVDDTVLVGGNLTALDGEYPVEYYALDRREADAAGAAAIASGEAPYEWSYEWFVARGSATVDVSGNTPPNLPKLSAGIYASWFKEFGNVGLLTTKIEYLYKGDYQARIFNSEVDQVNGYGQLNMFIQFEPFESDWRVWLTATNITDKANAIGRFVDPYGSGVVSDEYIAPRQIIANFSYNF